MFLADFEDQLLSLGDFRTEKAIAVGVSGGGDSMALSRLLSEWSESCQGPEIHVLSVDHGLRPEAADEVKQVEAWVSQWPHVIHRGLVWDGDKPDSKIQELARRARYDLMATYCKENGIRFLFLAHHANDQAETVLIRLIKGSGLDGLSGIHPIQVFNEDLCLVRPLLFASHEQLLSFCKDRKISWIEDPSNVSDHYLRPRLRKIWSLLEEEGLSTKRLEKLAVRMARARVVLDKETELLWQDLLVSCDEERVVFKLNSLKKTSEELLIRLFLKAFSFLVQSDGYGPRLERVESVVKRFTDTNRFKTLTLGGCLFKEQRKDGLFIIELEHKENE